MTSHRIMKQEESIMKKIGTTVIECAAEAYCVDAATLSTATVIREELSNQSLKMVAFISCIEDELDVQINLREAAQLKTIGDFVAKVNELAE